MSSVEQGPAGLHLWLLVEALGGWTAAVGTHGCCYSGPWPAPSEAGVRGCAGSQVV